MIGLASAGCSCKSSQKTTERCVSGGVKEILVLLPLKRAVASGMSSVAGAGVTVFLGCRRSCNRTSALVFIVASVEGLVGTGAGAPMGRPRGRGSVAGGSQWWTTLSLSNERAQWK